MSAEFIDTNVLVYAHDRTAGRKQHQAAELLRRLFEEQTGALNVQVLIEFYAAATRKLGIESQVAEDAVTGLGSWVVHRPGLTDIVQAVRLHRRYKLAWRDALVVHSAMELGCGVLWTEDLKDGQRFGRIVVRNPFA